MLSGQLFEELNGRVALLKSGRYSNRYSFYLPYSSPLLAVELLPQLISVLPEYPPRVEQEVFLDPIKHVLEVPDEVSLPLFLAPEECEPSGLPLAEEPPRRLFDVDLATRLYEAPPLADLPENVLLAFKLRDSELLGYGLFSRFQDSSDELYGWFNWLLYLISRKASLITSSSKSSIGMTPGLSRSHIFLLSLISCFPLV